jgi:hypothetical protein
MVCRGCVKHYPLAPCIFRENENPQKVSRTENDPNVRLLLRMLAGVLIGALIVAVYFGIDYKRHADERFYLSDTRDINTWLGPGVQSSEVRRVLRSAGQWQHNGVIVYTKP